MAGLNSILGLLSTVQTVERGLNSGIYTRKALEESKGKITELNVNQLYDQGINSLGIGIDTYKPYSAYTISVKKKKGQPYDRVTLRDTGDFHRSFEVVFEPSRFYITATDSKTEDLVERYGGHIFGLTTESREELAKQYVLPKVIKELKQEIFGQWMRQL